MKARCKIHQQIIECNGNLGNLEGKGNLDLFSFASVISTYLAPTLFVLTYPRRPTIYLPTTDLCMDPVRACVHACVCVCMCVCVCVCVCVCACGVNVYESLC